MFGKFGRGASTEVLTARRLAREYNAGLQDAIQKAEEHNRKVIDEFKECGVVRSKYLQSSLVPLPTPCPEELNMKWVRRFMAAFNWKRRARNTSGQYLVTGFK